MITFQIIQARKASKLTQKATAELLNVTRQKYNKMESGKMLVSEFEQICKLLDLQVLIIPSQIIRQQTTTND